MELKNVLYFRTNKNFRNYNKAYNYVLSLCSFDEMCKSDFIILECKNKHIIIKNRLGIDSEYMERKKLFYKFKKLFS